MNDAVVVPSHMLIHADEVDAFQLSGLSFICPTCSGTLVYRRELQRRSHFAHHATAPADCPERVREDGYGSLREADSGHPPFGAAALGELIARKFPLLDEELADRRDIIEFAAVRYVALSLDEPREGSSSFQERAVSFLSRCLQLAECFGALRCVLASEVDEGLSGAAGERLRATITRLLSRINWSEVAQAQANALGLESRWSHTRHLFPNVLLRRTLWRTNELAVTVGATPRLHAAGATCAWTRNIVVAAPTALRVFLDARRDWCCLIGGSEGERRTALAEGSHFRCDGAALLIPSDAASAAPASLAIVVDSRLDAARASTKTSATIILPGHRPSVGGGPSTVALVERAGAGISLLRAELGAVRAALLRLDREFEAHWNEAAAEERRKRIEGEAEAFREARFTLARKSHLIRSQLDSLAHRNLSYRRALLMQYLRIAEGYLRRARDGWEGELPDYSEWVATSRDDARRLGSRDSRTRPRAAPRATEDGTPHPEMRTSEGVRIYDQDNTMLLFELGEVIEHERYGRIEVVGFEEGRRIVVRLPNGEEKRLHGKERR